MFDFKWILKKNKNINISVEKKGKKKEMKLRKNNDVWKTIVEGVLQENKERGFHFLSNSSSTVYFQKEQAFLSSPFRLFQYPVQGSILVPVQTSKT
jgi:hypothetical protein